MSLPFHPDVQASHEKPSGAPVGPRLSRNITSHANKATRWHAFQHLSGCWCKSLESVRKYICFPDSLTLLQPGHVTGSCSSRSSYSDLRCLEVLGYSWAHGDWYKLGLPQRECEQNILVPFWEISIVSIVSTSADPSRQHELQHDSTFQTPLRKRKNDLLTFCRLPHRKMLGLWGYQASTCKKPTELPQYRTVSLRGT